MASHLPAPWTLNDFLEWEAQQPERYEFIDGMIIGMVGGSVAHATVRGDVTAALRDRLRGSGCRALSQDVKVAASGNVHYPDVMVACSQIEPTADQIRDPVVIVEVLSRTTGDRDRGAKWVAYRELSSLRHYVLVTGPALRGSLQPGRRRLVAHALCAASADRAAAGDRRRGHA